MTIHHSEIESSLTGLRIGRCNAEEVCTNTLVDGIFMERYDLCRLKVSSEDEMASVKLATTGLPFFFSGSIRRYSTPINHRPTKGYLNPTLEFVLYDGSQRPMLRSLLADTWGYYPIGYYRTPMLHHLVNKEVELECVFQYYDLHNGKENWPDSSIMLMVDKGETVGFFALNKINGNLESHIGGILKPYQKQGYFFDMLTYIKNYCLDNGLPRFLFGARNENAQVQRIFEQVGFSSIGTDNVFHIASLLTFSQTGISASQIQLSTSGQGKTEEMCKAMYASTHEHRDKMHAGAFKQSSFQTMTLDVPPDLAKLVMTISVPIITGEELLVVTSMADSSGRLCATGHLWCRN